MIFHWKSDSEKTRLSSLIDSDRDSRLTHESRNIKIQRLQASQEKLFKTSVVGALGQRLTFNSVNDIFYYLGVKVKVLTCEGSTEGFRTWKYLENSSFSIASLFSTKSGLSNFALISGLEFTIRAGRILGSNWRKKAKHNNVERPLFGSFQ